MTENILLTSEPLYENKDNINKDDKIHLFLQYYIPSNKERYSEIVSTLYKNVCNISIYQIHLLNEEIYNNPSRDGLLLHHKIIQTNIKKRLTFQDVFNYVRTNHITGFLVI